MTKRKSPDRNRWQLILLVLLFAAPVVLAVSLYYGGWRSSPKAKGDLIDPAQAIGDVDLRTLDGRAMRFSALKGKWSLVYFGPADCRDDCRRALLILRQTHIAQHKNSPRVQRVFILLDERGLDRLSPVLNDYQPVTVLRGDRGAIERLVAQFAFAGRPRPAGEARIYVVDPLGNLVLHYGPELPPGSINKDLYRLLRVSRIG